LIGFKCPTCGAVGSFKIEVKMVVTFTDDGSDPTEGGDQEWDDTSYCECVACGHEATVLSFWTEEQVRLDEEAEEAEGYVVDALEVDHLSLDTYEEGERHAGEAGGVV
jgi:hypothetical protein